MGGGEGLVVGVWVGLWWNVVCLRLDGWRRCRLLCGSGRCLGAWVGGFRGIETG